MSEKNITTLTEEEFEELISKKIKTIKSNAELMKDASNFQTLLISIVKLYTEIGIDYGLLQAKFEYYKKIIDIVNDRQSSKVSPAERKVMAYNELIAISVAEGQINAYDRYQTSKMRFNRYKSILDVLARQIEVIKLLAN
ncbi:MULTISPECIES: hypothetical protein [Lactococcus]|uniref:Uncharacterized protein n=1 Tax=Lactococcus lactis TaxID=1358 RepID=A0AB35KDK2_9LACT|nr:hypothetical protein [Lactococcus lactis]MCT0056530.1 hypothetical protein [Lactococcus lactis subsp. lactis]MDG5049522.1 hypothetical protein [Lactococcus lactis]MDT2852690.1 hypothetical protein [Lactococcus lactis]MDT2914488.1 hypothetical protein [Lactococcus lactis]PAL02567.1 hypothetical protein B8W91_11420 [Lactococcus lactis]